MTKEKNNGQEKQKTEGKVLNFDHLVFWVANAKTASSYFTTRFGFKPVAVRESTEERPILAHAVQLNKITIIFESPTTQAGGIAEELTAHGDFVKDVAFHVRDLDLLVERAREGGAEVVRGVVEEEDDDGVLRYAVLKTYGDNTHTLIDRTKYKGILLPGFKPVVEDDVLNETLPDTSLMYIDHVEGNMADGTLEDSVSWYENNLNMHRFWCVDDSHDLVPYSCINSASVINHNETILLSMNEAAKGLRPTSKATEFVKSHGSAGVEHVALYTDDIVTTMRNLKTRGADIIAWPPTYYDLIREKLKHSSLKVAESIEALQENNILIDFDEKGYMLQAFTQHLQARPTLFIEILQRRNHRMRNLKTRGADIIAWPPTYYDLIREKLKHSSLKVAESIEALQENNILIDFDEKGYMLQAFTQHLQARPTLFIEILQRRNHRGFGAMNYKWVFEAIELLDASKKKEDQKEENA